jgi:hypothetical protein
MQPKDCQIVALAIFPASRATKMQIRHSSAPGAKSAAAKSVRALAVSREF